MRAESGQPTKVLSLLTLKATLLASKVTAGRYGSLHRVMHSLAKTKDTHRRDTQQHGRHLRTQRAEQQSPAVRSRTAQEKRVATATDAIYTLTAMICTHLVTGKAHLDNVGNRGLGEVCSTGCHGCGRSAPMMRCDVMHIQGHTGRRVRGRLRVSRVWQQAGWRPWVQVPGCDEDFRWPSMGKHTTTGVAGTGAAVTGAAARG